MWIFVSDVLNEFRNNFSVRFRFKSVAFLRQISLQLTIIGNDAIVDNQKFWNRTAGNLSF